MKKIIAIISFIIMGSSFAQTFKMDKEKLSLAQEKLIKSQSECRQLEKELVNDPFILNLSDEMKRGVTRGEISKGAADRATKMIQLMIGMSKDICSHIDTNVELLKKELASEAPTSVFAIKDHSNKLLDIAEAAALEIIELSKAPELSVEDQELLKIIGDIMVRATTEISDQRNKQE
jgi:hypothetical protein